MSHTIIAAPLLYFTGATSTAGAAAVMVTVMTPVAISLALGAVVVAVAKMEECQLKKCASSYRSNLETTLNLMQKKFSESEVTGSVRTSLASELESLRKMPEFVGKRISEGKISATDVERIRGEFDDFNRKIAMAEARLREARQMVSFHEEQVAKYLSQMEEKYGGDECILKDFQSQQNRLLQMSDSEPQKKASQLSDLSSRVAAMLDKLVIENLVGKLVPANEAAQPGRIHSKKSRSISPDKRMEMRIQKISRIKKHQEEIEYCFMRLKQASPETVTSDMAGLFDEAAASESIERVSAIRDEIKMAYQEVHEKTILSGFFKTKLIECKQHFTLSAALSEKVNLALEMKVLTADMYKKLFIDIEGELVRMVERQRRGQLEKKIREGLSTLDYVVLDPSIEESIATRLQKGEPVLLDTKHDEYKLLVKLAPNASVAIRLVRIVESERDKQNVSDRQMKRDKDIMGEWCKSLDVFKETLESNGVLLVEQLRVEDRIDYLTIEQLDQQKIDVSKLRGSLPSGERKEKTGGKAGRVAINKRS